MRTLSIVLLVLTACKSGSQELSGERAPVSELPALNTVTILQRSTESLPAPRDSLRIHIGDITAGEVLVQVRDGDRILFPRSPMSVGDATLFEFEGRQQMLALSRMVNLLVGRDYAEFHVGEPEAVCRAQIEMILERIEESSAAFLVRGSELDGKTMAARLRRDYRRDLGEIHSGDDFIERVATAPSPRSDPYRVRSASGVETPLARWIQGKR